MALTPKRKLTDFFSSPVPAKKSPFPHKPLFALNNLTPKRRKSSLDREDAKQYVLDAGQKLIGSQYCEQCGMVYGIDCKADIAAHDSFHNRMSDISYFKVTSKQFQCWTSKVPVMLHDDRYMFYLKYDTESTLKEKAIRVIEEIVNTDFGFSSDIGVWGHEKKSTVWVSVSRESASWFISAIMISEKLTKAQYADSGEMVAPRHGILGVNRIWTHPKARRQGIARNLVQMAMKREYTKHFALSDPTEDGKRLARSISPYDSNRFLVYSLSNLPS